ncbi:MAG: amylo-alpha-1,6-glucosidase [Chloroflexi bacterium]|nr:MAG: amylo-alpha-1,6-glucosidase [Chloroflexota bacterium]
MSVLEGNNFVVSDLRGDIDASPSEPLGLFAWDTRFLSRWLLTVDGQRPNVLSTDDLDYFYVQFFLVPGTGTIYVDSDLSIMRKRAVGNGFHEDVTILNHKDKPVDLKVRIEAAADFADLFEVKDALKKKGEFYHRIESDRLVLGYRRETFARETLIIPSAKAGIDEHSLSFAVHIEPHGEWTTSLEVVTVLVGFDENHEQTTGGHGDQRARSNMKRSLEKLDEAVPRLSCDWPSLQVTYRQSLIDLAALRFFPITLPGQALPAAGLPWFMTLFGRDSMIASYQALPFTSELAEATLQALAQQQGRRVDDFRDEEPGKIMHEMRFGEMTAFEERPHSPYYGAADATPLFLILLDEVERWTGNAELVRQLEMEARAALTWIDKYGDRNGDGYVEYSRRNTETGLVNQCWKDSWNSILFADGTLSRLPRATCEIQGYVYDAKMRAAHLAREFWHDPELADRLEKEAAELKHRFNRDFWLEDREFFALAIDGDGRKVDALTSNIGHLLWSGIVEEDKAEAVVRHLMGPHLYSGWGVRTMAEGEGGYNPIGYHLGTIWPHDNAFIAMGLRRYGYREEAARVAMGMLEAATYFKGRLPEAFAGYPRQLTEFPVEYPTACSPQAWASGAPLLLLRAILGLEPIGDHLLVDPAIPSMLGQLELLDIPGRWGRIDAFGRGRVNIPAVGDSAPLS